MTVPLRIDRLVFRGDGLARMPDGRVAFVPLTAPGDEILGAVREDHRDYVRAEAVEIRTASPLRVAPACPHFGACGGCQWLHLGTEGQTSWKAEILRELLARVAHLADPPVRPTLAPLPALHYRTRAQLKAARDAGRLRLGFFRRASRRVVDIGACPLLHPLLNEILSGLNRLRHPDLGRLLPGLEEVWLSASPRTGECLVALFARGAERRNLRYLFHTLREQVPGLVGLVLFEGEGRRRPRALECLGRRAIRMRVRDLDLRVDAVSFFQVSEEAAEALVAAVEVAVGAGPAERVLDCYCGVGTLTLPLARRAGTVTGVEAAAPAWADAVHNARTSRVGNATVLQRSTEAALMEAARGAQGADLVVLDPPRQGLSAAAAEGLVRLAPRRIVYASCDPSTLARDVGKLRAHGYALTGVQPLDLFPQTYHLEAVAVLDRSA